MLVEVFVDNEATEIVDELAELVAAVNFIRGDLGHDEIGITQDNALLIDAYEDLHAVC